MEIEGLLANLADQSATLAALFEQSCRRGCAVGPDNYGRDSRGRSAYSVARLEKSPQRDGLESHSLRIDAGTPTWYRLSGKRHRVQASNWSQNILGGWHILRGHLEHRRPPSRDVRRLLWRLDRRGSDAFYGYYDVNTDLFRCIDRCCT